MKTKKLKLNIIYKSLKKKLVGYKNNLVSIIKEI